MLERSLSEHLNEIAEDVVGVDQLVTASPRAFARFDRRRTRRRRLLSGVSVLLLAGAGTLIVRQTTQGAHPVRTGGEPSSTSMPSMSATSTIPGPTTTNPLPAPTTTEVPGASGPTLDQLQKGTWKTIPKAPTAPTIDGATIWTGTKLFVWGGFGESMRGVTPERRAALYDPSTRTWQVSAPAPIPPTTSPVAVWSGSEVIVWGGLVNPVKGKSSVSFQGAAYNPTTNHWRIMRTPVPFPGATSTDWEGWTEFTQRAVWTGKEVLIVSGAATTSRSRSVVYARAYDPVHDSWHNLPGLYSDHPARDLIGIDAVEHNGGTLVWLTWQNARSFPGATGEQDAFKIDTTSGWSPLDQNARQPLIDHPIVAGHAVVASKYEHCISCMPFSSATPDPPVVLGSVTRDGGAPGLRQWKELSAGPFVRGVQPQAWTGRYLLRFNDNTSVIGNGKSFVPGVFAALDLRTGIWTPLPSSPVSGGSDLIWTGDRLLTGGVASCAPGQYGPTCNATGEKAWGLEFDPG
jgi:hypothetical protein